MSDVKSLFLTKLKRHIEKEDINYNIGHAHSGHDVGSRQQLSYFDHAQIKKKKKTKKRTNEDTGNRIF